MVMEEFTRLLEAGTVNQLPDVREKHPFAIGTASLRNQHPAPAG
jgi:hypothetical protein